jgi:hypothetical protein
MAYTVISHGDSRTIVDEHGAVLYDGSVLTGLSDVCIDRLAELHTENDDLEWEDAALILESEGFLIN